MSNYNPRRRAPNVSQYIAGLNQIHNDSDLAAQEDHYNFDDDLALFTNTEFVHNDIIDFDLDFDFDLTSPIPGEDLIKEAVVSTPQVTDPALSGLAVVAPPLHHTPPQPTVTSAVPAKKQKLSKTVSQARRAQSKTTVESSYAVAAQSPATASTNLPIALGITIPDSNTTIPTVLSAQPAQVGNGDMNFEGADYHYSDIGFTPQTNIMGHDIPYGPSTQTYDYNVPPQSPFETTHQLNTPVTTPPNGQVGVRPQGILPDSALLEASSRAAAEEDKRRRNTAASARFRYKKKQRETALEKSAKDMTDKLDRLEDKVTQLEKENTWLRSLVVERTAKSSEEMAELYKTFKEEERSKDSKKKGVGTTKVEN